MEALGAARAAEIKWTKEEISELQNLPGTSGLHVIRYGKKMNGQKTGVAFHIELRVQKLSVLVDGETGLDGVCPGLSLRDDSALSRPLIRAVFSSFWIFKPESETKS